jgi:hypothetical protein
MGIVANNDEVVEYSTVGLDPVDTAKVESYAIEVMEIIDYEDEETIENNLWAINDELTNDERIELASILKTSRPEGTRKSYVSIYNEWLRINRNRKP